MKTPKVELGQVWEDMDPRHGGRRVRVFFLHPMIPTTRGHTHAECCVLTERNQHTGRYTRIRLDRFRPGARGYRLVEDEEQKDG